METEAVEHGGEGQVVAWVQRDGPTPVVECLVERAAFGTGGR